MLTDEMAVVKEGMAHGELSLDAYTTVWEECLSTKFYISKHRTVHPRNASLQKKIEWKHAREN